MGGYSRPVPLAPEHQLDEFDCESPAQTDWLRRFARVAQASDTSKVYVVTTEEDLKRVVAYYALATGGIDQAEASERIRKGTGAYAVPAIILTRLGVDKTAAGQGVGRSLVRDALIRVERAASIVGVRALLVHAESPEARDFYRHIAEFDESPVDRHQLMLLMKDIRAMLRAGP